MLEDCATISSCETRLQEYIHLNQQDPQVQQDSHNQQNPNNHHNPHQHHNHNNHHNPHHIGLLGQIPFTNNDYEMICNYVSDEFSYEQNSDFEDDIANYPATVACYLVLKGIFNYSEGAYWNSVRDDIHEFNPAKSVMLGKAFLRFVERNGLFHVDIPRSQKYVMPILMHGIIPQEQVQEYFDKIIYPLVTRELISPTDTVELSYWLKENRNHEKEEERFRALEAELGEFEDILPGMLNGDSEHNAADDTYTDPDAIFEEIDARDSQIKALSGELQSLDQADVHIEQYQRLKRDIATARSLETTLIGLKQNREEVSDQVRTASRAYKENPLRSIFPENVPDRDAIIVHAENELMDSLSHVAKTGSPQEKERLRAFIRAFSEGIDNESISLSDEARETFQTLLSISMADLPDDGTIDDTTDDLFDDTDEMTDISASHAQGITAIADPGPALTYLGPDTSEPVEYSQGGAFQDIQSFYDVEDTVPDIPPGEPQPTEATHPPDQPPETSALPEELTEVQPVAASGTGEDPCTKPDTGTPGTGTNTPGTPNKALAPTEPGNSTTHTPGPELGRIARALAIQIQNDQNRKPEQSRKPEQNRTLPDQTDTRHTLSAETVLKVRDELRTTHPVPDDTHSEREVTDAESADTAPAVSPGPKIPHQSPAEELSLWEDETPLITQNRTPDSTEHMPVPGSENTEEPGTPSDPPECSFEVEDRSSANAGELHTAPEHTRHEPAGVRDPAAIETCFDAPARPPVADTPPRAISLADDPKISEKFRKKSLLSRLLGALFRK